MLRRVAIVSAFAATLAMPLLSGCGIRGPLYMPKVPPPPTRPDVPDPGLGNPHMPMPDMPASQPESTPAAGTGAASPAPSAR
jgi:diaminopimelate decarboxylase